MRYSSLDSRPDNKLEIGPDPQRLHILLCLFWLWRCRAEEIWLLSKWHSLTPLLTLILVLELPQAFPIQMDIPWYRPSCALHVLRHSWEAVTSRGGFALARVKFSTHYSHWLWGKLEKADTLEMCIQMVFSLGICQSNKSKLPCLTCVHHLIW